MNIMKTIGLRIVLVLSLVLGFGTTGSVWAEEASGNVKIEQWAGHSFTFLALPDAMQGDGYEIFTVEQVNQGLQGDRSVRLPYAEHVGKQVTVTEVVPFDSGFKQPEYMVYMTVNDTGEKLAGRSMRDQLEGLVLTADLDNARQQFVGKTVYPKYRELSAVNVPGTMPQSVTVAIGDPVTVVDVYTGNQLQEPISLVVSVNGEKAMLPIAYSWTNLPIATWTQTPPWQGALFMEDPRSSLGGSQEIWNKIHNGDIEEGMNKGQVRLSWGKPVRMEENSSVWFYGTTKLSFNGDVLASIETHPEVLQNL